MCVGARRLTIANKGKGIQNNKRCLQVFIKFQRSYLSKDSLESEAEEERAYILFALRSPPGGPLKIDVLVNESLLEMGIDTGGALSIIGEVTYKHLWGKDKSGSHLSPTSTVVRTYTGEKLSILGRISVRACYKGQASQLSLLVVEGDGLSLMDRDWLRKLTPRPFHLQNGC